MVAAACGGGTKTGGDDSIRDDSAACHHQCTTGDERPSVHPERDDASDRDGGALALL